MTSGEQAPGAALASLLHGTERLPIASESLSIGRAEDNDLTISDEKASRRHAVVFARDGEWWVADLGSRHGTSLNGERVEDAERQLASGDTIEIGKFELRFLTGEGTRLGSTDQIPTQVQKVAFGRERVRIGRDPHNDLVLADPNISRFHAEVVPTEWGAELRDLASSNGTRLNGHVVAKSEVVAGDSIGIGPYQLVFEGDSLSARDEHGAISLRGDGLTVSIGEKTILKTVSVSLEPGELVALIGESGSGKSTLMKLMAGVTRPSTGAVSINGEPISSRLTDVGYVPQDDIVHALLTVEEALDYAARLRLPADSSDEDRAKAVGDAIAELSLESHTETLIGSLSGGQRKRTSVASEVLGRPGLLFLDEPTTGMDPGLETRMMELFRRLADRDRGVALVTHATKNLALCDRVIVMASGGHAVFDGSPAAALEFFGVEHYDDIYTALAQAPAGTWEQKAQADTKRTPAEPSEEGRSHRATSQSFARQVALLTSRSTKLLVRDRRNLMLLLVQAPVLALAGIALFGADVFDSGGNPAQAIQLLFLAVITVIWFGAIDAAREIVKEQAVFSRESAVGLRLSAYLTSKVIVLFTLVSVQTLLYAGPLFAFRPLNEPAGTWLAVFLLLLVIGFTAVTMGLLVSALVSTEDQAMSVIPLAVIPQLLFAGTIVPLAQMPEPAQSIANAIFSQWGLAAVGDSVGMNERIDANAAFSEADPYGATFFDVGLPLGLAVQAVFMALFMAGTVALVRRRLKS